MSQNPFVTPVHSTPQIDRKALVAATPVVGTAAKWFWWIAGLSLVNTILVHLGSETSFVIGLGFTLIADYVFRDAIAVALVIDAIAIGFFVAMGFLCLRGHLWAFVLGGFVYLLDALIYVFVQDYMSLLFHGFALFSITIGAIALKRAITQAQIAAAKPGLAPTPLPETALPAENTGLPS